MKQFLQEGPLADFSGAACVGAGAVYNAPAEIQESPKAREARESWAKSRCTECDPTTKSRCLEVVRRFGVDGNIRAGLTPREQGKMLRDERLQAQATQLTTLGEI